MPKTYFMSDAHLGLSSRDVEREKEQRLLSFFDFVMNNASQLFILGDLFDAWFEYRTVVPKGFHRTLTKLEDIVNKKIAVHYLAGNHDYWMGDSFRELGINVYHEEFETNIDGKKIYLHHGDGLAHNDNGYRILKKILRNPINIKLYKLLHPDIGLLLAKTSSKKSRNYTASKHYGEEDGMIEFAQGKINEGFDAVIMGHRHVPDFKQIGNGVYINLGDWISHCTYAVLSDGTFELKNWND